MPKRIQPRRYHNSQGVLLSNADFINLYCEGLKGKGREAYAGMGFINSFIFVAYPGPEVVDRGRAEHLPYHFHVKHPGKELRIEIEDFEELNGLFVPKDLCRLLREEKLKDYLARNTINVYKTGKRKDPQLKGKIPISVDKDDSK